MSVDRTRRRLDDPRLGTMLRLAATGGRQDGIRIVLTAVGSGAAGAVLFLAFAVLSIGPHDGPYRLDILQQSGLRPGVVTVLVLLTMPILAFVAQCSRVGAPARDRRLASLRMAGGTPTDVRRIVALETGVASLLGSFLGAGGYLIAHLAAGPPLPDPTSDTPGVGIAVAADGSTTITHAPGGRLLPTDVMPHPWMIVVALLLVPVAATAGSILALRRTAITPFGVIHHQMHQPPTTTPAVLFIVGAAGLASWQGIYALLPDSARRSSWLLPAVTLPLFVLTLIGLSLGSAPLTYYLGRLIAPRTRRPALLIAARRMIDVPHACARPTTAIILAVLLGAGLQEIRVAILAETSGYDDPFYADTLDLLNRILLVAVVLAAAGLLLAAAEAIVGRRRTLASLRASGTPQRTLAESTLWETVVPLVPTTLLATTAGALAARGIYGAGARGGGPGIGVPWVPLAILAGGTLLAATIVTLISLAFLPHSTDITELRTAA